MSTFCQTDSSGNEEIEIVYVRSHKCINLNCQNGDNLCPALLLVCSYYNVRWQPYSKICRECLNQYLSNLQPRVMDYDIDSDSVIILDLRNDDSDSDSIKIIETENDDSDSDSDSDSIKIIDTKNDYSDSVRIIKIENENSMLSP